MSDASASLLAREIGAQPEVLERFRVREGERVMQLGAELGRLGPAGVLIAARGSSDHAAVYAKYLLGLRLGLPVALAAPSFATLYDRPLALEGWVALGISQSGVSPDVVSVVAAARAQGCRTLAITDDEESVYRGEMGERYLNARNRGRHYWMWRTNQVSDHFPKWVELRLQKPASDAAPWLARTSAV